MSNEAQARLKINALLQQSGWHLTEFDGGKINVRVEGHLIMAVGSDDSLGTDFEKHGGRVDYLLYDNNDKPVCVLEAKSSKIHPLSAKEQARDYAKNIPVRYILLSNGNAHYFWDLQEGDPREIDHFPTPESITENLEIPRNTQDLINLSVDSDFLVQTQYADYQTDPLWYGNAETSKELIDKRGLCFLRKYQVAAVQSIQQAIQNGKTRFLFEMATGTGKTSTSAAVIRLFIKSKNAKRVLFLVDRLELEEQARKAFTALLSPDITTVVFKERQDSWQHAEVVVTTIQSIMNKYGSLFSPTDFDLIISDEAHRLISGNGATRNVFEYFVGYKLGLTATPKDFLKNFSSGDIALTDPREIERRKQFSTYQTFGCESGQPTFSYTLTDGVRDGFLVNPVLYDCRTQVTTQLLSDQGFAAKVQLDDSEELADGEFTYHDFEKRFFSENTNKACMETFLQEAERDPISGEVGKSLIFAVSQNHAAKLTQLLNEMATKIWPDKYSSDFAMQVTSNTHNAQQHTIQFANNNLSGQTNFLPAYKSSRTRICVTVGMMSTGYDCQDILNIGLMRPIFSPSEFIQIKGRGTRIFTFKHTRRLEGESADIAKNKSSFKLFDFFANCEYFQEKYDYQARPKMPPKDKGMTAKTSDRNGAGEVKGMKIGYGTYLGMDITTLVQESFLDDSGMKIDQELAQKAAEKLSKESEEKDKAKESFATYLEQNSHLSPLAEKLWHFYIISWFNPQFVIDMKERKIARYTANPELFVMITSLPIETRDEVITYINQQKS